MAIKALVRGQVFRWRAGVSNTVLVDVVEVFGAGIYTTSCFTWLLVNLLRVVAFIQTLGVALVVEDASRAAIHAVSFIDQVLSVLAVLAGYLIIAKVIDAVLAPIHTFAVQVVLVRSGWAFIKAE